MRVREFRDEASWIEAATGELLAASEAALGEGRSSLALCLAGGHTPERAYRAMAALPLAALSVELWLGDERAVPPGDAARNGGMVERAFAACAWEPRPRIRPWPFAESGFSPRPTAEEGGDRGAEAAALSYEAELRSSLGPDPAFDLAFLGLGADGHTASVFDLADEAVLGGSGRLAIVTRSPLPPHTRMTLTLGLLKRARRRIFLVRGEDKLPALRALEAGDSAIPASFLSGPGALALYLR